MQDISVKVGKCTVKFVILSNGLASKFVYGIEGCSSERKKIVSLVGEYVGANTVRPYIYRLLGFTGYGENTAESLLFCTEKCAIL